VDSIDLPDYAAQPVRWPAEVLSTAVPATEDGSLAGTAVLKTGTQRRPCRQPQLRQPVTKLSYSPWPATSPLTMTQCPFVSFRYDAPAYEA
jgi:hypothetical protein